MLKRCITVETSLYGTEVIDKCFAMNLLHSEFIKSCLPQILIYVHLMLFGGTFYD